MKIPESGAPSAAVMGHIDAYNLDSRETQHCYVGFKDPAGERISYLSLDETGWVFTELQAGTVYLAQVYCTVTEGTTKSLQHEAKGLAFQVPGAGKIAYFGHVGVQFGWGGENLLAAALTPPVVKAFLPGQKLPPSYEVVEDQFAAAKAEFSKRFGADANRLTPVNAVIATKNPATPAQ